MHKSEALRQQWESIRLLAVQFIVDLSIYLMNYPLIRGWLLSIELYYSGKILVEVTTSPEPQASSSNAFLKSKWLKPILSWHLQGEFSLWYVFIGIFTEEFAYLWFLLNLSGNSPGQIWRISFMIEKHDVHFGKVLFYKHKGRCLQTSFCYCFFSNKLPK